MQQLIDELRQDGLNDDEIVWYAVNMHNAVESEVRQALHPEVDPPGEQGKPAGGTGVAEESAPIASVSPEDRISHGGAWVVVKALLISAIVSVWTAMFSLPELFRYSSRESVVDVLLISSAVLLLLWSVLRQVSIALPGNRLACAVRPILFVLFALGLEQGVGTMIEEDWGLYLPGLAATSFTSLLFFEIAVTFRRWLNLALVLPLVILHFVFLDFSLHFYYAISSAAKYGGGIFGEPFRFYVLSGAPGYQIASWMFYSFLIGFTTWALLGWCGRADPGKTLPQWKNTLASLPGRLLRGEVGLARSFWYFGVLGGTPIRVVLNSAVAASAMNMVAAAAVIGALYWSVVTLAVWRSGEDYQGSMAWWGIAVALSVLSVVSLVSVIVLVGMNV